MAIHESEQTSELENDASPGTCDYSTEQLFEANVEFAKSLARRLYAKRVNNDADFLDYVHYAMIGLLESVNRYQPESSASFQTFARYRIEGAMRNGVAKFSEYREQLAFRYRFQQDRLKSITRDIHTASRDAIFAEMVELTMGLAIGFMLDNVGSVLSSEDAPARKTPYARYLVDDLQKRLANNVDLLPARERAVIQHHYFHYMGFEDIADLLGVTKGRISQMHKSALSRLREDLSPDDLLDTYY